MDVISQYSYNDEKLYGDRDFKIKPLTNKGNKNYIENNNRFRDPNKYLYR